MQGFLEEFVSWDWKKIVLNSSLLGSKISLFLVLVHKDISFIVPENCRADERLDDGGALSLQMFAAWRVSAYGQGSQSVSATGHTVGVWVPEAKIVPDLPGMSLFQSPPD